MSATVCVQWHDHSHHELLAHANKAGAGSLSFPSDCIYAHLSFCYLTKHF